MKTECGGIDPARHVRFHSDRAVKKVSLNLIFSKSILVRRACIGFRRKWRKI